MKQRMTLLVFLMFVVMQTESMESTSPIKLSACLRESNSHFSIQWTIKNDSGKALQMPSQLLPWGTPPYGADLELIVDGKREPPVLSPGSDRSFVELNPGTSQHGTTPLATTYPSAAAKLRTADFSIRWKYEFRPPGSSQGWTYSGVLSKSSMCAKPN